MIDTVMTWFALYGAQALFLALFAGQTGLIPVPTTIILLTVGAMFVDETIEPISVFVACLTGAVLGDQFGYCVGRAGGPTMMARFANTRWAPLFAKAEHYSEQWGAIGVFLSRWLVSPIGPYLNYMVGLTQLSWWRFSTMSLAGEAIWIAGFMALGYGFSSTIAQVDGVIANITFFVGAGFVTLFLGLRLRKVLRRSRDKSHETS